MKRRFRRADVVRPHVIAAALALAMTGAQADEAKPGSIVTDCPTCPPMVVVPAGEFVMGSPKTESGHGDEKPQHTVKFAKPFAISKTEVTFDQWDACTAAGKCPKAGDDGFGRKDYPAINVSWKDAQVYAAWLSETTGKRYRLPSEAEWEYAARAGTTTPWFWGPEENSFGNKKACEYANTHDESGSNAHPLYVWSPHQCNDGFGENAPTAKFKPNPWGLHDMLGNVREWVEDCHVEGYAGAPEDGAARKVDGACEKRVVRGGAWVDGPSTARAAYRYAEEEGFRNYQVGIRILRELP